MQKLLSARVLIVEDDVLVCEMVHSVLEQAGYTVVGEASCGSEAMEAVALLKPDVVLMDVALPDFDGIEITRRINETCPTPVVILTAYETPELIDKASRAGAGAYLVKPPRAHEIDRAIVIARSRFNDIMGLRLLNETLQARNRELEEALSTIKTLRGLVPICAHCKNIRDDHGYWQSVERYITNHSEAQFSHGLCPACAKKYYAEYLDADGTLGH